ncbi:MAG: phosphodiester glycosidase family protein, partial [bacterium]
MAARVDREGHRVVAAINGDFYDTGNGAPINLQLRDGEILRQPTSRSVFAISSAEKPVINFLSLIGNLQSKQGAWHTLHGFNRARNADELIFFNHYFGAATGTNSFGSEARLRPLEKFAVNDTFRAVVREFRRGAGNLSLDDSTYIISAHGAAENWLVLNLAIGDTVKLLWRVPETRWQLVEAIGGLPRIVRDGNISIESEQEGGSASFTNNRHPRSAIGFNADTSRFFFVTVDGRQPGYSDGMTLPELAAFMRELGCEQALNLDGGGSTTMVVRGKVVNRPSDATGERAVANALLLISTAITGPLAHLEVQPRAVTLRPGENLDFAVIATDSLYNPLNLTAEDVFWKVSPQIGSIDSRGLFTANSKADSGHVIAFRGQARDSVRVVVK